MTNTFYEGVTDGAISGAVAEVIFSRVSDHACRCDECKILDERDLPMLALCKQYLKNEIDFDQFRDAHIRTTLRRSEAEAAFHRHFRRGSTDLDAAVEFLLIESEAERNEAGHCLHVGQLREVEFRIRLEAFVYGYELRMRTVHFWEVQNPEKAPA